MRERPQLVLGQDIRKRSRASPDERRRGEFSGEGHQKPENSYSLAYNLENQVQHVKLQYEHCGYRIGECKKFKGKTIKELMERVIEYSKTGRHLFSLRQAGTTKATKVRLRYPISKPKRTGKRTPWSDTS